MTDIYELIWKAIVEHLIALTGCQVFTIKEHAKCLILTCLFLQIKESRRM